MLLTKQSLIIAKVIQKLDMLLLSFVLAVDCILELITFFLLIVVVFAGTAIFLIVQVLTGVIAIIP